MLKLRIMGTKKDLGWFKKVLKSVPEVEVTQISECYGNKGTNRYSRMYAEVEKKSEKKA